MQKDKILLLFTNNYPSKLGDTSFIDPEVDELSKIYKHVYIVRLAAFPITEPVLMPSNFTLLISGFSNKKEMLIKGIFNNASNIKSGYLFLKELFQVNRLSNIKNLIYATLIGRYYSSLINQFLMNNSTKCDLYFFWGIGCSYALPWLSTNNINKSWVRLHGIDLYEERQNGYIPYRELIFKIVNYIVPISEHGRTYLIDKYPQWNLQNKIILNRLGSKDYSFKQNNHKHSLSSDAIIVSCSSIIPLKRVDLIYKCINLASIDTRISWVHFGDGPSRKHLEDTIQALPPTSNLSITIKGQTLHEEVMAFFKQNNVSLFINLSETEGIPVSIMEAISFNIPVLATNTGGVNEIVGESFSTGILIPVNLEEHKISKIIYSILNGMNFSPRNYWENNFNKSYNMKSLIKNLDLYDHDDF